MCKFFGGCLPSDPRIQDMNSVVKMWMFHNWIEDQNDDVEIVKNHAYLLGSFSNPEAVRKLMGDDTQTHVSTDEEFEESTRLILKDAEKNSLQKGKRRKRKLKE